MSSPTGEEADQLTLVTELRDWVGEQVGAIAKPDEIRFTDNLPKTRSGKIMRRLLRAIARVMRKSLRTPRRWRTRQFWTS